MRAAPRCGPRFRVALGASVRHQTSQGTLEQIVTKNFGDDQRRNRCGRIPRCCRRLAIEDRIETKPPRPRATGRDARQPFRRLSSATESAVIASVENVHRRRCPALRIYPPADAGRRQGDSPANDYGQWLGVTARIEDSILVPRRALQGAAV